MRPGAWDTAGFLLPSSSLPEVLAQDARSLDELGVDAGTLAERLTALLSAAAGSDFNRPAQVGEHHVELIRQRGLVTCPWAPDEFEGCPAGFGGRPTANRFRIRHRMSQASLEGFELTVHLAGAHRFFGGPGTRYRIEPEQVVAVLDRA